MLNLPDPYQYYAQVGNYYYTLSIGLHSFGISSSIKIFQKYKALSILYQAVLALIFISKASKVKVEYHK